MLLTYMAPPTPQLWEHEANNHHLATIALEGNL